MSADEDDELKKKLSEEIDQAKAELAALVEQRRLHHQEWLDKYADANEWFSSRTLSADFLDSLERERSDWAFIVKLAAVSEAVLTDWLSMLASGQNTEFQKFLGAGVPVTTSNGDLTYVHAESTFGQKILLTVDHSLLPAERTTWMKALNELRNRYVHKIEFVNSSIAQVLASFKPSRAFDIVDAFVDISIESRRNNALKRGLTGASVNSLCQTEPMVTALGFSGFAKITSISHPERDDLNHPISRKTLTWPLRDLLIFISEFSKLYEMRFPHQSQH